jgi:hypothetical protein
VYAEQAIIMAVQVREETLHSRVNRRAGTLSGWSEVAVTLPRSFRLRSADAMKR